MVALVEVLDAPHLTRADLHLVTSAIGDKVGAVRGRIHLPIAGPRQAVGDRAASAAASG